MRRTLTAIVAAGMGLLTLAGCSVQVESETHDPDSLALASPRLRIPIPDRWQEMPLDEFRAGINEQAESTVKVAPEARGYFDLLLQQVDDGVVVAVLAGPMNQVSGFAPSVIVTVESGADSLEHAAKRHGDFRKRLVGSLPVKLDPVQQETVALPIGAAIVMRQDSYPSPGVPTTSIDYVLLIDGKSVSLSGAAPKVEQKFAATVAKIAEGISRS